MLLGEGTHIRCVHRAQPLGEIWEFFSFKHSGGQVRSTGLGVGEGWEVRGWWGDEPS